MPNLWFRMYSEFADDPKVQMMPEVMQRRLVMLFCERCKREKLADSQRAFHWRISVQEAQETKALFVQNNFIDEKWNLLNWNKRQFISDSSTERVRKHRKQDETLPKQACNGNGTAPDTDTDTDTDQKELELSLLSLPATEPKPEDFASTWNRLRGKLPRIADFTESRRKKVQTRIKAGLTIKRFSEAIENCRTKPFLAGENDRSWVATFDWLIKNEENIDKAINNPYGLNQRSKANGRVESNIEILRNSLANDKQAEDRSDGDVLLPWRNDDASMAPTHGREIIEGKS